MQRIDSGGADCCKSDDELPAAHDHCTTGGDDNHNRSHRGASRFGTVTSATIHCLTGCVIGEAAGLAIGVSLGWAPLYTTILAFTLAYISGFTLGILPVMKRHGATFKQALKMIWIGEAVSIFFMEVAMNLTDYHMGGMSVGSIAEPLFWISLAAAIVAGFLAAWPVNWILIGRGLKKCH